MVCPNAPSHWRSSRGNIASDVSSGMGGTSQLLLPPTFAHWVFRTPHLLLDRENRVVGVLAGRPQGAMDWGAVHDSALSSLESVSKKLKVGPKVPKKKSDNSRRDTAHATPSHRRGSYVSISHGLSFGGGQEVSVPPFP